MCYQTAGGGVGAPPPDPRWGEEVDRGRGGRCEWRGGTALIELTSKHFSKVSWWKRAGDGHRTSEAMCVCVCVSLLYVHQRLAKKAVCVCVCDVCEAVGEVWGCEGEGYPTASERKRGEKREGALLHVEGKRERRDEKWRVDEWLCSPEGPGWRANSYREITAWHGSLSFIVFLFLTLNSDSLYQLTCCNFLPIPPEFALHVTYPLPSIRQFDALDSQSDEIRKKRVKKREIVLARKTTIHLCGLASPLNMQSMMKQ